jgi:acyl CoA:acetate/3-ketoacid CoA transferase alpha subunit
VTVGSGSKARALADAVRAHVRPGMHLHFASTPSRSNAAVREVARAFYGQRPAFTLSTTGFHSMAHLLPMLHLGGRLVSCFFGDNHPAPRPNALYTRQSREGVTLEHWSLWSFVSALRAGAQGDRWAFNRSLAGTSIAADLAARGQYQELPAPTTNPTPDPTADRTAEPSGGADDAPARIGLVAAMRPDLTFVHGAVADDDGHVLLARPFAEGLWSALAARRGIIATVEKLAPRAWTREHPDLVVLPPHRVLAVCEEPFGAHPQPFLCVPNLGVASYRDDFEHYQRWREMTSFDGEHGRALDRLLRASDGGEAYRAFVGHARLDSLCVPRGRLGHGRAVTPVPGVPRVTLPPLAPKKTAARAAHPPPPALSPIEQLIVAGARQGMARARATGARVLLAGIGHAFFAARIAQQRLAAAGQDLTVMVETGLYGVDCGPDGDGFLLAYDNLARARRLTDVEDVLGTLGCGADNRCLAILGAAQVDRHGNLNSTRLGNGEILVGSGGACDIAALVDEAIVLMRLAPGRLVDKLPYVTGAGRAVRSLVTDCGTLVRAPQAGGDRWSADALAASAEEQQLLSALDPDGTHRQRSRP